MVPTSANRKAIQLLDKYKCSQCKRSKHNASFSQEIAQYLSGQSVNAVTAWEKQAKKQLNTYPASLSMPSLLGSVQVLSMQ
jgi:hypothetical protein